MHLRRMYILLLLGEKLSMSVRSVWSIAFYFCCFSGSRTDEVSVQLPGCFNPYCINFRHAIEHFLLESH